MAQMTGLGTRDQNAYDARAVSADELKGESMEFKTLDDILEFAISKEVEAEQFYLSLCEEETLSGNRQTFHPTNSLLAYVTGERVIIPVMADRPVTAPREEAVRACPAKVIQKERACRSIPQKRRLPAASG